MNVAFIIFRRPELTARVFERIRQARPDKLFVIADGPKTEADRERCRQARTVVETIDWPCEVFRNYSEVNLGCKERVVSGLDWVFSQVEDAIILEDDCLPDPTFFRFCQELLDRYRDDRRIGYISGNNFTDRNPREGDCSYHYSVYGDAWGWATWGRSWRLFDRTLDRWPALRDSGWHTQAFPGRAAARYMERILDLSHAGTLNAWGYAWLFTMRVNGLYMATPAVNLVSNIGFGAEASLTKASDSLAGRPVQAMPFPLRHPAGWTYDVKNDLEYEKKVLRPRQAERDRLLHLAVNKHFYGGLIRRIPVAGRCWAWWRERRKTAKGERPFTGPYRSWAEARAVSTGYDADAIFRKTVSAREKVLKGEAAFERDSVLFDSVQYAWPLLACLLWIASKNGNRLHVTDFGGSLGTSYFQNAAFLSHLSELRWGIVEQKPYVEYGRRNLENKVLRFHETIEVCLAGQAADVLLLSGVLMYLERPYDLLQSARQRGFRHVLVDRTPFIPGGDDILRVQNVPPQIFDASYPCWFFGLDKFRKAMGEGYETVAEFDGFERAEVKGSCFKGFLFRKTGGGGA